MLQHKVGFNLKNTLSLEITDNLLGILLEDESGAEHNLVHQLGQGELVRLVLRSIKNFIAQNWMLI